MNKKIINECDFFEVYDFTGGSIDDTIIFFTDLREKYNNVTVHEDCCYESTGIKIKYEREETDKEFVARQKKSISAKKSAEKRKIKKEAEERKELQRLKEKYG